MGLSLRLQEHYNLKLEVYTSSPWYWNFIWKPDTLDETPQKCSYQYIPSTYWYMMVRKIRNSMYAVCTSTGVSYWYVPCMYIMKLIYESMYWYVLDRDKQFFCGMPKSPSVQMLQDIFHLFIRAYLSVLFKKIRCWPVCLYTRFVLSMYSVHT